MTESLATVEATVAGRSESQATLRTNHEMPSLSEPPEISQFDEALTSDILPAPDTPEASQLTSVETSEALYKKLCSVF